MRVLFVHPPPTRFDSQPLPDTYSQCRVPPLAGITLAAHLRAHGHCCYVIDGNRLCVQFSNRSTDVYRKIVWQALKFKPELVAVTILTANMPESARTVKLLREALPKVTIIAGGPHPSGEPNITLRQIPELDGIGTGPGEDTLLELADGKQLSETAGCYYLDSGETVFTRHRHVSRNIDRFPFPLWDLIDSHYYSELNHATVFGILTRSISVLTSRGCPRSCIFCSSAWNRPVRFHSAEYVVKLCQHLSEICPIDTFAFWDDTIAAQPKRIERICEAFIHTGFNNKFKWFAMLRADQIKSSLLELMKDAGCFYVGFGAESGSNRVLKILNKGTTVEQNLAAAKTVHESGLLLSCSLIVGSPTETADEMQQTAEFCKQIKAANLGVCYFRPLPGSPAYSQFVREGKIDPAAVDWTKLGNFGFVDEPCFAAASISETRKFFTGLERYCYQRNMKSFAQNNKGYPEIVKLHQYPSGRFNLVLATLKKIGGFT